jgi:AcrR family transcriptional regulator
VLQAALALADEGGLDALTMQGIGRRIGAEAMSLYRHVRNKNEILDGLVDLVFAEIELPEGTDWRAVIRTRALSARAVFARHPWAVGLMDAASRPGPANLRHHDAVLGVLRSAGFSSASASHAYSLLDSYIYGFAIQERSLPIADPETMPEVAAAFLGRLPTAEYPNLARVAADLMAAGYDYGAEFEFGLELILDGLERTRDAGTRRSPAAGT